MPSGVYPDFKDKAKTKPHPAKGLSVNKYKANGELRPARKSRAKAPAVQHIPVAETKFKSAEFLDSDDEPVKPVEPEPVVVKTKKLKKKKLIVSGIPYNEFKKLPEEQRNAILYRKKLSQIDTEFKGRPLPDITIQTEMGAFTEGFNRATADFPRAMKADLTWDGRGRYDTPALIDINSDFARKNADGETLYNPQSRSLGTYSDEGRLSGVGGLEITKGDNELSISLADDFIYNMAFGSLKDRRNDPILQSLAEGKEVSLAFGGEDGRTPMLKPTDNPLSVSSKLMGHMASNTVGSPQPQLGVAFAQPKFAFKKALVPLEKEKIYVGDIDPETGKKRVKKPSKVKLKYNSSGFNQYTEEDMLKGRGGMVGMPKFKQGKLLIYGREKRNLPIASNLGSNAISGITKTGIPSGVSVAGISKEDIVYADTGQPVFTKIGPKWFRNEPEGGYISGYARAMGNHMLFMEDEHHQNYVFDYYEKVKKEIPFYKDGTKIKWSKSHGFTENKEKMW
jgi:hypothetical protein